jgi:hypothetical protein
LVSCPREFKLFHPARDAGLITILLNGRPVPRYSCAVPDALVRCLGPDDETTCAPPAACVPTWNYLPPTNPPDPLVPGGTIPSADHFDFCAVGATWPLTVELIYILAPD